MILYGLNDANIGIKCLEKQAQIGQRRQRKGQKKILMGRFYSDDS